MAAEAWPAVAPGELAAIARDALLARLQGNGNRALLEIALNELAALIDGPVRLQAQAPQAADGDWMITAGRAGAEPDRAHALVHLGQAVGTLWTTADAPPLDELVPTLAALIHAGPTQPPRDIAPKALLTALGVVGTFVWDWDIDADRLSADDGSLRYLGYDTESNGPLSDWESLIHDEDRPAVHAACERHLHGGAPLFAAEYRVKAADGRWRWFLERGRIIEFHPDGRPRRMVGALTDTTERHAAANLAEVANQRLAKIARHVPGVLYQLEMRSDARPRFRYVTERLADLIGADPERSIDDVGILFRAVLPEDRQPLIDSLYESARTLTEWRHEFRVRAADGSVRWILGMSTPQREDDGCLVWHGYLQDVTVRRELEAARRDIASAEAGSRAKTDFLSRMSHELRTPLNAVLGFAQLLELDRAPALAESHRQRVVLIRQAGEHLLEMIRDLLDLTRIESGTLALEFAHVPLRPLADEAVRMVQPQALKAGVRLQVIGDDEAGGPPLAAWADRTRLKQVMLNLLSNAIKYNRPDGWVELELRRAGDDGVQVIVEDAGVGIPPETLQQLFEPFQRGAQARGKIEGTGIGLSVTRGLVQAMAGRIEVHSTPDVGSSFIVTLPADLEPAPPAA